MSGFQRCRADRSVGFQRCHADRGAALRLSAEDIVFGASDEIGVSRRQVVGAALAASVTGGVVAGPAGAVAAGASAAFAAAKLEDEIGDVARSVGEKVASFSEKIMRNDTIHETLERCSSRRQQRLSKRMSTNQAPALLEEGYN